MFGYEFKTILIVVFITAFVIARIPYFGKIFKVINTLIHESCHAIVTLLLSGNVLKIELFADSSGNTLSETKGGFRKFLISISGYTLTSLIAFLMFYLIKKGWYNYVLYFFIAISAINIIFFVRNIYGVFWVIVFGTGLFLAYYYKNMTIIKIVVLFVASFLLIESFVSSVYIFYISMSDSVKSGDAKNLADLTHIHSFFWGLIFFVTALSSLYLSINIFFHINLIHLF